MTVKAASHKLQFLQMPTWSFIRTIHARGLYMLETVQPRQTNHELTRVKEFFYGNVFNVLRLIAREEFTILEILSISSQVFKTFTSSSLEQPLLEHHRFIKRQQMTRCSISLNLCSVIQTPIRHSLLWNPPSSLRC